MDVMQLDELQLYFVVYNYWLWYRH